MGQLLNLKIVPCSTLNGSQSQLCQLSAVVSQHRLPAQSRPLLFAAPAPKPFLTMVLRALSLLSSALALCSADLTLLAYPNGAWGGAATQHTLAHGLTNGTLPALAGMGAADIFSLEVRGTLTPPTVLVTGGATLRLSCDIANGNAFVWLDDHVVCEGGHDPAAWGKYASDATVLPWEAAAVRGEEAKPLFLRVTFAHPRRTAGAPSISLNWAPAPPP